MVNTTSIQSADRSWHAGEVYFFGSSYDIHEILRTHSPDLQTIVDISGEMQFSYNITGIDLIQERYQAIYTDNSGPSTTTNRRFIWEDFVERYLENLFDATYVWDYEHNSTVLTGFSISSSKWTFIEPQWDKINSGFANDFLNTSEIIATVNDPYSSVIHNITLGSFLNDTSSYTIMGKDNLEDAKNKFTEKVTKWFLELDLTGLLMTGIYNSTLGYNLYHPAEKATISYEVEYSKGGVLNKLQLGSFSNYTFTDYSVESLMNHLTVLGGIESLEGNFPILMVFPAIIFVAIFALKIRKEKNRRVW